MSKNKHGNSNFLVTPNVTTNHNFTALSNGFTLLELLITTALTIILLLTITSLFITSLLSNSKTNAKKSVKEEGLQAMSRIEFLLKNAHYIDTTTYSCTTSMSFIDVVSLDGELTTLGSEIDPFDSHKKISSNSTYLTSSAVTVSPDIKFDCSGEPGNRQIKISFGLEKVTPDGTTRESFDSSVNLRN